MTIKVSIRGAKVWHELRKLKKTFKEVIDSTDTEEITAPSIIICAAGLMTAAIAIDIASRNTEKIDECIERCEELEEEIRNLHQEYSSFVGEE